MYNKKDGDIMENITDGNIALKEYLRKIAPDFSVFEMIEKAYYTNKLPGTDIITNRSNLGGLIWVYDNYVDTRSYINTGFYRAIFKIQSSDRFNDPGYVVNNKEIKTLKSYIIEHSGKENSVFQKYIRTNDGIEIRKPAILDEDFFLYDIDGYLIVICNFADRIDANLDQQPTIEVKVISKEQALNSNKSTDENIIPFFIGVGF